MFGRISTMRSTEDYSDKIKKLKTALDEADAVIIGAGAGMSTSAGFTYSGERFDRYFSDFGEKYGFKDMYSGGFYPYPTPEEMWAYWSRYIFINRYMDAPKPVYEALLELVKDKDYFASRPMSTTVSRRPDSISTGSFTPREITDFSSAVNPVSK